MTEGTARFTQHEWISIIDRAEQTFPSTPIEYKAPNLGTEAFTKAIDHTLLKLGATKIQIDRLCEEARRHNFQVCEPTFFRSITLKQINCHACQRRCLTEVAFLFVCSGYIVSV